jgi:membrane protease subunit HflC
MRTTMILIISALLLLLVSSSLFVVDQAEQAILVQFGEPVGEVITKPGLHWKKPFMEEVRRFDKRVLPWDGDVSQVPTLGREFVLVDTTARWRISNPLQFMRSVRDEQGARTRLDDIIDSVVRDIISGTSLEEIVRSKDWKVDVKSLEEELVARQDVALERPKNSASNWSTCASAASTTSIPCALKSRRA